MQERWKDIKYYEGIYQVSDNGRVKSLRYGKEKILNPEKSHGYLKVGLWKDGYCKHHYIHRLVAKAFIPNPDNLIEVNHKNEFEKENNNVNNLEWCTSEYNSNYGTRNQRIAKKKSKPIVCVETGEEYESAKVASIKTGINYKNINACCRGVKHRPTAGGYHWRYKEVSII